MPKGTNGKTGTGMQCKKKAKRDRESADNIPRFDLDAIPLDTYHVLLKNEMLQEMYREIIKRISMRGHNQIYVYSVPHYTRLWAKNCLLWTTFRENLTRFEQMTQLLRN